MNLAELVTGHDESGNAVHDGAGWHTWGEVRAEAGAVARLVRDAGVAPGERVALSFPGSAAFVAGYLGVLAAGAVAVPLNPSDPPAALADELAVVAPALVVGAGPGAARLDEAAAGRIPVLVGSAWEEARAVAAGAPFAPVARADDDLAVLLFTSGTAGAPKAAMLSHGNLLANLRQLEAVPEVAVQPGDIGLSTLPLFHIFGLNVALGLSLLTGGPLAVVDRFVADEAAELVEALGVTVVVGAPAAYAQWLAVGVGHGGNGSGPSPMRSLRLAVAGGAPVPAALARDVESQLGVPLHQGYGLTEASPAVTTTIGTPRPRPGSAGRALPGVEIRLVDESGEDVLAGDPGEVWVRGPNVFAGYWRDEAATTAVRDGEGWLHTGDVGVCDDEGELYLVDRRKDLIIVSGFNVFPAEVEQVLSGAPGVAEGVVVGRPDPLAGEVVEAVVVPTDPDSPPDEAAVIAHCATRLPRYKCPAAVRIVTALPRTVSGETLRRQVRGGQQAGLV